MRPINVEMTMGHSQKKPLILRDSKVHVIKSACYDEDKKGYTAAETLLRDLEGLDHIDITGRSRQKTMQLSYVVSLQKNCPLSFPSILLAGKARFMTTMKDFDRWFQGTYMQRDKGSQS